jgi:polyhydroxyalkanoate synthesis regulator phasin
LDYLTNPGKIPQKETKDYVEDILRKYIEILPEKKKHYFKTKRFKKKKEIQTGMKLKGF